MIIKRYTWFTNVDERAATGNIPSRMGRPTRGINGVIPAGNDLAKYMSFTCSDPHIWTFYFIPTESDNHAEGCDH